MLVPAGVTVRERELGGGWGQLWAEHEGVKPHGLAELGAKESDGEIEQFAVRTIGIPANEWKMIDSGKGRGWERYKTFEAVRGNKLHFGYGVGARATTCSTWNDRVRLQRAQGGLRQVVRVHPPGLMASRVGDERDR